MSTQRRMPVGDARISFSDPEPIRIRKIRLEYVIIAGDIYTTWDTLRIYTSIAVSTKP